MIIEAIAKPLNYRWPGGEIRLEPGQPVHLPDDRALRLLERAGEKVRRVVPELDPPITADPASPVTPPIYWESVDGQWHGPVKPEYLGRTGSGASERFWVIVTYRGATRWIQADLLRSRRAFEAQVEDA